ncbi:MAG: PspC domain-containing protein [Micromonosporaceae bacterium]
MTDTSAGHGATSTEAAPPGPSLAGRYGLIRPRTERQIAGVCAGIARATQTDPLLWRVLVAVGVLFGGIGLVAYLLGWLLMPEEGDTGSPLEALFGRGRSTTSAGVTVLLAAATTLLLILTVQWTPLALLVLAGIAYLLYRQVHPYRPGGPPTDSPAAGPPGPVPPGPVPPGPMPSDPVPPAADRPGPYPPRWIPPGATAAPDPAAAPEQATSAQTAPEQATSAQTESDATAPPQAEPDATASPQVEPDATASPQAEPDAAPSSPGEPDATAPQPEPDVAAEPRGESDQAAEGEADGTEGVESRLAAEAPGTVAAVGVRRETVTVPVPPEEQEPGDSGEGSPPATTDWQAEPPARPGHNQPSLLEAAEHYRTGQYAAPDTAEWPAAPKPEAPAKQSSRLGRVALFAVLIALGLVAALDLSGGRLGIGAYAAAALAVIGAALVVGTWVGRARWLIWIGATLSLVLAVSAAIDTVDVTMDGGQTWRPHSVAEIQSAYEIDLGDGKLDLRQVDFTGQDVTIRATVNAGNLKILLPPDVDVTGDASVKYGNAEIFDEEINAGSGIDREFTNLGADGKAGPGSITLLATVNAGNLEVQR